MSESNLDEIFGEESGSDTIDLGDEPPAEASKEAGAGEEMTLDPDLASMLADSESEGEGGAESIDLDSELAALGGQQPGEAADEGFDSGGASDLGGLLGGEAEGAAAPAPAAAAPSADGLAVSKQSLSRREAVNLDFLLDVKLDVTFEVGRSKMMISDLLTLGQGSVVELHRLVGEELDLLVNGKLIAKGEVVVVNEKFGCKISEIVSPEERIKHLAGY